MNHSSKIAFVAAPLAAAVLSCGVKYGDPVGTGSAGSGGGVVGGVAGGGGARGGVAGGGGSGSAAAGTGGAAIPLPGALPEFCTADGWCGSNLALAGVWGSSAGDVWVVANRIGDNPAASAVLHWDGSRWTTVLGRSADYLGADLSDLDAVWGTGPSDVWVAGSAGTINHWDGVTRNNSTARAGLVVRAIWGSGANDAWAVGDAGAILHWDGAVWAASPAATGANLSGVWGSGARDVWAVGDAGAILHWNGAVWTPYQDAVGGTATTANLRAVWGSGAADVWAVGDAGVVLRSDGAHWRISAGVPTSEDLKAVWGAGPSDVWAAGAKGTLLHWTGAAWYTTPAKTEETLLSVWGSGAGELWAVGDRGSALYWDRTTWQATAPRPIRSDLFAVSAASADDVWVAGAGGVVAHFDGTGWREIATGEGALHAVFSNAGAHVAWMAGDRGKILQCYTFENDLFCTNHGAPGDPDWLSIWASSETAAWIGGGAGAMRHWDGSSFVPVATGVPAAVVSIWGSSPTDIWAATDSDVVLHWDGQAWSPQKIPGGGNNGTRWRVVSGTSPQDVWLTGTTYFIAYKAGGAYSVTAHYDGSGWSAPAPAQWPADPTFTTGAWPTGTGVLWAVGPGPYLQIPPVTATAIDNRPIMRWDSSDARAGWTRSLTGSRAQLFGISGIADGQMWIVGAGGTILHRGPQSP